MLSDDLADFAEAVVTGQPPSLLIDTHYSNYDVTVAVEVYRNNYRGNLHDALAGAYPVIAQLVGGDFFRLLTRAYIGQHPSKSGNLHHYGAEMANFLAAFEPAQGLNYLPDVARLEWVCHLAYFAEDAEVMTLTDLAQIPPEHYADLILHFHPSCHLLRSDFPVVSIWQAHQSGADSGFLIDSGASCALVSRVEDEVRVNALLPAQAEWLAAMRAGVTLGEATEITVARFPEFDLQAILLILFNNNSMTSLNLKGMS